MNKFLLLFLTPVALLAAEWVDPVVIAHRGASSEAPENTMAAFQSAIDLGVDYIEMDIQMSQDGVPVIFHDVDVSRTSGRSPKLKISKMKLPAVKSLDVGSWFHSQFAGQTVPTLAEVFRMERGKTGLLLEIKGTESDPQLMAQTLARLINFENMTYGDRRGPIIVTSKSLKHLKSVQYHLPRQHLIPVVNNRGEIAQAISQGFRHLSVRRSALSHDVITWLADMRCRVWAWTIDDPLDAGELVSDGVEGIITNNPRVLLGAFN